MDAESKFLKKHFDYLFKTMQKICSVKQVEDEGVKQMAIEVIANFAERQVLMFKNHENYLREYLKMVFAYMIAVTDEPDEGWTVPNEGDYSLLL